MDSSEIEKKLNDLMKEIEDKVDTEKIANDVANVIDDAVNVAKRASDDALNAAKRASDDALNAARRAADDAAHYINHWDSKRVEKNVVAEGEVTEEKIEKSRPYTNRVIYRQGPQPSTELDINRAIYRKPKGGALFLVLGILLTIVSGIGFSVCFFTLLGSLLLGWGDTFAALNALAAELPLLGLGIGSIVFGGLRIGRQSRVKKYMKLFQRHAYCNIEDLAKKIRHSEEYVRKDVKKLIQKGVFPQGHLDDQESCLMLNDKIYGQYLESKRQQEQARLEEEQAKKAQEAEKQQREQMDEKSKKLYESFDKGQEYLNQIRSISAKLKNKSICLKLEHLEIITEQIFLQVKKRPENLPEIRKLLDYYLPTIVKMLVAYEEFETQPLQGENIVKAKEEIENSLDIINEAFEKIFDNLFDDTAMDISADISVLHTMLANEGLTGGNDFDEKNYTDNL